MIQLVCNYIESNNMIVPGDNVVLGISGGADSVCLLFVLLEYKKKIDFSITAVHINHMIRGEEANRDQEYVENLCRDNNIECDSIRINIPMIAKEKGLGLEEAARIERYRIFNQYNADKIAVAHHSDDLAETMIFNLVRGTGLKGLASIKAVNGNIIRPLLCVTRKEIETFLDNKGVGFCLDSTNEQTDYSRNRIRNNIIPELSKINDKAVIHMRECAEYINEAEIYLDNIAQEKYLEICCDSKIDIEQLLMLDEIIKKRVIKKAIVAATGHEKDITSLHVREISRLADLQSGKKINLPYNIYAIREYNHIVFYANKQNDEKEIKGQIVTRVFKNRDNIQYPEDIYTKWFDCAKIKGRLVCRYRKAGDFFHIKNGKKKLQDFFSDIKIPAEKRDDVPLICDDEEVVWIVGYRINENYKISSDTTEIIEVNYITKEIENGN